MGRPRRAEPKRSLSITLILEWAKAHHEATGSWPRTDSGEVLGTHGEEKWLNINQALRLGLRGLRGGQTLTGVLQKKLGVHNRKKPVPLTEAKILAWARAHHRRTGAWPTSESGPVEGAPGEVWKNIDAVLRLGHRGLPGGSSLAQFLAEKVGRRNRKQLPPLDLAKVLEWADAHKARTGRWPSTQSGPILDARVSGETWRSVDDALREGLRGQPGGDSLFRLLKRERGARAGEGPRPRMRKAGR